MKREIPWVIEAVIGREVGSERHVRHRNLVYIFALLTSVSYPGF
jgi:hypothetical protein